MENTRYVLYYSGPGGAETTFIDIDVAPAPPSVVTFTAQPESVDSGGTVRLEWNTSNATSARIEPYGPVNPVGSISITVTEDTEFELIASGPGGETRDKVSVSIVRRPAPPVFQ